MRYSVIKVEGNLCEVCKFTDKCNRYKKIMDAISQIESSALEYWALDLRIDLEISDCNLFKIDPEIINGHGDLDEER